MARQLRIHVSCRDDRGLLATVAQCLYELDGALGDATFALLGEQAELTCVCAVPDGLDEGVLRQALRDLPGLADGEITVRPFRLGHSHAQSGRATHIVRVSGQDRPGLVAQLAEGFSELGANVVRFDSDQDEARKGAEYWMRFEVWIPKGREDVVLAHCANTAEAIGLSFWSGVAST